MKRGNLGRFKSWNIENLIKIVNYKNTKKEE